jgi:hypothetical protein
VSGPNPRSDERCYTSRVRFAIAGIVGVVAAVAATARGAHDAACSRATATTPTPVVARTRDENPIDDVGERTLRFFRIV